MHFGKTHVDILKDKYIELVQKQKESIEESLKNYINSSIFFDYLELEKKTKLLFKNFPSTEELNIQKFKTEILQSLCSEFEINKQKRRKIRIVMLVVCFFLFIFGFKSIQFFFKK